MIKTKEEYENTRKALGIAENALKSLQKELSSGDPTEYEIVSEPYINEIHKLRYEIDEYLGIILIEENTMPLWVRIQGPRISDRIPMSIITDFLREFRSGIQQIARYKARTQDIPLTEGDIRHLSNIRVRIFPGSLKIGFSVPPTYQEKLDKGNIENITEEAIKDLIKGASWSQEPENIDIDATFPDPIERHMVISHVEKMSSLKSGEISSIEFKGRYVKEKPIILNQKSVENIKRRKKSEMPSEVKSLRGVIREIDLDGHHFFLKISTSEQEERIFCKYDKEMEDDVKVSLDREVEIMGDSTLSSSGKEQISVKMIELIEEEDN